jgi:hypothetical protein
MEAEGFSVYESEWWHFDYRDWKSYAIQNVRFEALDPCTRFTWDVSRELTVMQQTPRALAAAVKPGADVPQIEAERLFEVKLALQSAVTFVAKPGKPTRVDGAHAGLVRFRVEKAGRYRVSISSGHWIDVVDGSRLMSSRDFQGQHRCQRPHKIVEFDLPADRDLTLQFSGSTDAQIIVAITAVSKPAAG